MESSETVDSAVTKTQEGSHSNAPLFFMALNAVDNFLSHPFSREAKVSSWRSEKT